MNNPAGLTLRELEVELLAEQGASYKEMALVLDVEVSTIQSQIKAIKKKYATIGIHRGQRYLMTPEKYKQRITGFVEKLEAHRARIAMIKMLRSATDAVSTS